MRFSSLITIKVFPISVSCLLKPSSGKKMVSILVRAFGLVC